MSSMQSPLLNRLDKQESLTLDNLALHVPRVHAGKVAKERLEAERNTLTADEWIELSGVAKAGEESREMLVLMGLPLVRTIAHKEYNRRKSWNSRVSFEDILQEGIGGLIRGINAYNVNGGQRSATNYLGHWISSDIRRHIESMEHDFSIPHETMERYRKIRAIRSLLQNKLGRTPTDQEIVDHANSDTWNADSKMGRLAKDPSKRKPMTLQHVQDETSARHLTGAIDSIVATDSEEGEYERPASPLTSGDTNLSHHQVEEASASESLTSLFEQVFRDMGIAPVQEDIIRQKFGMRPYDAEVSLANIAKTTKLTKYKINQVVSAFSTEMASPGSSFHKILSSMGEDEIESMGMGWVVGLVGEYRTATARKTPSILLSNMRVVANAKPKVYFGEANRDVSGKYWAKYNCPKDNHTFKRRFQMERNITKVEICPSCGNNAYFTEAGQS